MKLDMALTGGLVVGRDGVRIMDVGVRNGRIVALGDGLDGGRQIDAAGKLVIPGGVDIHLHLEMPIGGNVSADDFFDGTAAAACGGTTTVVDFVEPRPAETFVDALTARRSLAAPKAVVDYGFHMTLGPGEIDRLDQVPAAYEAGARSFKMYMAYGLRLDDGQMLRALEAVKDVGGLPVVHAENWDVIQTLIARNLAAGRTDPTWHPRSRPALTEGEATARVIALAEMAGTRVHIFHVSAAEAARAVADARRRGLPVTGETCPQYLLLTSDVYARPGVEGALPVCSPPIREQVHQDALWEALASGDLQTVATDHCPFSREEKAAGLEQKRFDRIPGGVPGIEVRLSALYSEGVRTGRLTPEQWVDSCCTVPADLMGLPHKGRIAVGADADLVVFDPEARWTVSPGSLRETVGWTPYDGQELTGRPVTVLSRGEVIVENGACTAEAGRGRFLFDRDQG